METKYTIIALIGKAGAGKDFLLQEILKAKPEYHEIISHTTRPPREGEVHGKNYYFVTEEEFAALPMLEEVSFRDWHYGTSLSAFDPAAINIGVFNPEGLRKLSQYNELTVYPFYVYADTRVRLIRQLSREQLPDIDEIYRRYNADNVDFGNEKEEIDRFVAEFHGKVLTNMGDKETVINQIIGQIEEVIQ